MYEILHREYINLVDDDLPEEDSDMQLALAESYEYNKDPEDKRYSTVCIPLVYNQPMLC